MSQPKTKKASKNALTPVTGGALGVTIAGALIYLIAYPAYTESNELKVKAGELAVELTRQQELVQQLDSLKAANIEREQRLATFNIRFPKQERFSAVLQRLENEGAAYNVKVGNIRRSIEKSDIAGVDALRLDMTVEGSYKNVRSFMRSFDENTRFASIDSIKIQLQNDNNINANIKISTYLLRNAMAQEPAPASAAPTGGNP